MTKPAENKGKKQKKKKEKFIDDGRTIADMNVEGMPWYRGKDSDGNKKPRITFKERMAILKGAFSAMLVPLICTLAGLTAAAILIYLWLML